MNYSDKELQAQLAGEYVIGTLQGAARRRFERLLREDHGLELQVRLWERHLSSLNRTADPVSPPDRVWTAIQNRIDPFFETAGKAAPPVADRTGIWFKRVLGTLATAATILFGVFVYDEWQRSNQSPAGSSYVAVVNNEAAEPLWLVNIDNAKQTVSLNTLREPDVASDKSLELWLLPNGDAAPVSLGLLPATGNRLNQFEAPILLADAKGLAVSLEPAGGSTTGAPTGPVLYQAALFQSE